jgi:hypothetical protein
VGSGQRLVADAGGVPAASGFIEEVGQLGRVAVGRGEVGAMIPSS